MDLVNQVQQDKKDGDVDIQIKIAPNATYSNATILFTSTPLTPQEENLLKAEVGGTELVNHINSLAAAGSDKLDNALAEARTGLDAIHRGQTVIFLGGQIAKGNPASIHIGTASGVALQTEIDVRTREEMIEVKGGDYSSAKKLSGRDLKQFTNQKRIFEGKTTIILNGQTIPPPTKWIYQFTAISIDERLQRWLIDKGVTEVRTGQ